MATARQTPLSQGQTPLSQGALRALQCSPRSIASKKRTFDERGLGPSYGGLGGHGAVSMVQPKGSAAARADCRDGPQRPSYPHSGSAQKTVLILTIL
jgi:hypothetical protein